jgi:peptidoglycan biosynthesis protein MviN/MurJ (putative lipid II flippase)
MRDTRTVFWLYALENGLNIGLAFALYGRYGIQGIAVSYSIAYFVAAIVALVILRSHLGTIGGRSLLLSSFRALVMALVMAVVIAFVITLTGTSGGLIGWIKLAIAVVVGAVTYLGGAGLAGTIRAKGTPPRVRGRR